MEKTSITNNQDLKESLSFKELTKAINKIGEDLYIHFEKEERKYQNFDLNNQQYVILTLIIQNPEYKPSEIAKIMNISKSAISQQLVKLESKGFIKRYRHEEDKRSYGIKLSEKGQLYKNEIERYYDSVYQRYKEQFSYEELVEIYQAVSKLKQVL
ncbi:MarR family transcriptional regulator [Staphylococcus debuckii]|uniref:MarR family transcriptional regulator n=1 Tax=Staphylococcus debuckii TaxID=2044912 RepID=UPI000F432CCD|nr:MarR family transcriptional regulator [Staphylococcus debuckii]AYU55549.1 MarR family transcriptional regulator [Staphylococcus debuckii]